MQDYQIENIKSNQQLSSNFKYLPGISNNSKAANRCKSVK